MDVHQGPWENLELLEIIQVCEYHKLIVYILCQYVLGEKLDSERIIFGIWGILIW
jgi:hypothetical protein